MKVLIIEDEPVSRKIMGTLLGKFPGLLCDYASDIPEALFFTCTGNYDLVFLDIMMPEYNGQDYLDMVSRLIEQQHIKTLNVVIMTAMTSFEKLNELNNYAFVHTTIQKPVKNADIRMSVELARRSLENAEIVEAN